MKKFYVGILLMVASYSLYGAMSPQQKALMAKIEGLLKKTSLTKPELHEAFKDLEHLESQKAHFTEAEKTELDSIKKTLKAHKSSEHHGHHTRS
jgi:hypothetical protein